MKINRTIPEDNNQEACLWRDAANGPWSASRWNNALKGDDTAHGGSFEGFIFDIPENFIPHRCIAELGGIGQMIMTTHSESGKPPCSRFQSRAITTKEVLP